MRLADIVYISQETRMELIHRVGSQHFCIADRQHLRLADGQRVKTGDARPALPAGIRDYPAGNCR